MLGGVGAAVSNGGGYPISASSSINPGAFFTILTNAGDQRAAD
jgi:hypothetical protein